VVHWGESRKQDRRRRFNDRQRWRRKLMLRAAQIYPHPFPWERIRPSMRTWDEVWESRREYVSRYYRNRKVCAGYCCRNSRRSSKIMTPGETRAAEDARTQCDELGLRFKASRFRSWS